MGDAERDFINCGRLRFPATWVDRFSIDMETGVNEGHYQLTPIQTNKFSHFFRTLLDHDQDELISEQDIETLVEVNID